MILLSGKTIRLNCVSIINVLLCISRYSFQTQDRHLNVRCHKHSMQSILRAFYINELTADNVLLDRIELCNIQNMCLLHKK